MANPVCLRQRRNPKAFTLAELLIVIAIIGVLIAILLPALSAARRSANSVKCLASLKEVGQAFQLYAQENKRYFPVVRWRPPAGIIPSSDPSLSAPKERIWIDFLAKYLHKKEINNDYNNLKALQGASAFWGCPAYNQDSFDGTGATDRRYSVGYAMSIWAIGPYNTSGANPFTTGTPLTIAPGAPSATNRINAALIDEQPQAPLSFAWYGQFFKMEQWGRKGQDKVLVADSSGFDLMTGRKKWTKNNENANPIPASMKCQPLSMGLDYPIAWDTSTTNDFVYVDGTRHLAATSDKRKVFKSKGVNCLYVDGHAAPASPREVFIGTYGAGYDLTN